MAVLFALELVILTGLVVYVLLRPQRHHRTWVERRMKRRWRRWRQRVSGPCREPLREIRLLDQLEIPPEPSSAPKLDERQPAAAGSHRDRGLTDPHELGGLTGAQPCVLGVGWPHCTHLPGASLEPPDRAPADLRPYNERRSEPTPRHDRGSLGHPTDRVRSGQVARPSWRRSAGAPRDDSASSRGTHRRFSGPPRHRRQREGSGALPAIFAPPRRARRALSC